MSTPIDHQRKAQTQIAGRVGPENAEVLLGFPKRAILAALLDLVATQNGSDSCDDTEATFEASLERIQQCK